MKLHLHLLKVIQRKLLASFFPGTVYTLEMGRLDDDNISIAIAANIADTDIIGLF